MSRLTMGSLFDGIGGFPLAAIRSGITPVWASEIEAFPIEVTRLRFPDMLHVGDITKLHGAELPPVDIICGGSPCQDLSVAGARAGLAGARSGLFMEQMRIVREMRLAEKARGQEGVNIRPRWMCWENVPGAFSSGTPKYEDFRIVLEEIVRICFPNELISTFTDLTTKNAADLVTYAIHAWESGWGYVWGTYGNVLTESLLTYKVSQYPDGVGNHEDIIRTNWLGGRTADCVGLIKGYGWLSPETMTIDYGTHGMPDIGANQMYYNAKESGPISTMPDIPGLAVWHDGHIGVYIGNGQVIEAMGTRYGVVKTELAGRGWTHWLKVPYICYD